MIDKILDRMMVMAGISEEDENSEIEIEEAKGLSEEGFRSLTPSQQIKYIKEHPNSKYGKDPYWLKRAERIKKRKAMIRRTKNSGWGSCLLSRPRSISDLEWDDMSPKEQKDYIAKHPKSRFAKEVNQENTTKTTNLDRKNFGKEDAKFMRLVQQYTSKFSAGKDKAEWGKLIGKLNDKANDKKLNEFLDNHYCSFRASDLRNYVKKFGASLSELKTGKHKVDYPDFYKKLIKKRAKISKDSSKAQSNH